MTSSGEHSKRMAATPGIREWLPALGVSFATALLVISPFFFLGNASGHDFGFHAASWLDVAGQWKEGIFFPRWTEWANHGFGEPRFIFYPPLSWMLGAALGMVAPWNAVPGVFIVVVQTIAGVSLFALARRFLPRGAALFGAACYAANPYALLIVTMRSDFAEQLACALLPLVVLTALQLCQVTENRRRLLPRALAFFAVAFAAVWLCNAPAGVLATYSAALLFAWAAFEQKSLRSMLWGAGGLALGFGLTSFYLLPAAYEQRWVNIAQALSSGLQPSENFLYTMINDPEHNVFNWIASSVAVLLMVMTGLGAIAAHRGTSEERENENARKLWRVLLVVSAAATVLMIRPSSLFWAHLPELRFVQFPWRWMAILAVPYGCFLGAAMARGRLRWTWAVMVIFVSSGTAMFLVRQAWWDSEDIPVLREAIANDQGFEGTDEYDPLGDDHTNLPEKAARVQILPAEDSGSRPPKAEIRIARWTAEEKDLRILSAEPVRVALRLLNYPAWHVELNGKTVTPQHAESSGQMVLSLTAGTQRITARFVRTPDRKVGIAISWAALLTLLALLNAGGVRLLSASP
jgi:6-pyruvoyl-tetrahydropterin synthase related domain